MVKVLRQALDQLAATATASPFPTLPAIDFRCALDSCPLCGARLYVKKTSTRQVATLHIGPFTAQETVLFCRECDSNGVQRSAEIAELVPKGGNFGYDVIIAAGRSLLLEHRTAEETVAVLAHHHVCISESGVRELAARFVAYLGIAHLQAAPALCRLFSLNGGYILHLDSTSRLGSRKLLSGIDELTGLVLLNVKLGTETADDVAAFLRDIVNRYGPPLAVGCDMAASIRSALHAELGDVPVYICHFHFLRDAGNDMMKEAYQRLSMLLDSHKISTNLGNLKAAFLPHLTTHIVAIEQFLANTETVTGTKATCSGIPIEGLLVGLLFSALAAEKQGDGYGFPFDRTHLLFYRHLMQVHGAAQVLRDNATCPKPRKLADKLLRPLTTIHDDAALADLADSIDRNAAIFDEMRRIMRIAEPGSSGGLPQPDADIDTAAVNAQFSAFKAKLQIDNIAAPRIEITKLIEQIDRHWEGLFRKPLCVTAADGVVRTIQPQRTNNIMEHFFRDIGRNERRRTGLDMSTRRLNAMLPDTPLACNLKNPDYVKLLLDGCDSLEQRFSRIEVGEVRDSLAAARSSGKVFAKPRRACNILRRITTPLQFAVDALKQALAQLIADPA